MVISSEFPLKGDLVEFKYSTKFHVEWGRNNDPDLLLEKNHIYEVEKVEIRSYHVKIYLKGIKGRFNWTSFSLVERSKIPLIKIAYLHGLESTNASIKTEWLQFFSELYAPSIDYTQPKIYKTLKNEILKFQPDFIIGSSMGGYFAFEMAQEINCPAILFNPALHSRSMEPDMTGHEIGQFKPNIKLILGEKDTVIEPQKTLEFITHKQYKNTHHTLLDFGHRTPFKIFQNEVKRVVETERFRE